MKKSLVFTKSIAFEKNLIDRLEEYLSTPEREGKRINFSGEVANLIEAGLAYKQVEKDLLAGRSVKLGTENVSMVGKAKLRDLIKDKIEFGETALEQPKPVKGLRMQKL
jgi:hypothetical protein